MTTPTNKEIYDAFDEADDEFPEKSTEFLGSIVADRLGIDYGDVIDGVTAHSAILKGKQS